MSNLAFFTHDHWNDMFPFGRSHSHGQIRLGALKLNEWWSRAATRFFLGLEQETKLKVLEAIKNSRFNDRWLPTLAAIEALSELRPGQSIYADGTPLLVAINAEPTAPPMNLETEDVAYLANATDLFSQLATWLEWQHELIVDAWSLATPNLPAHVTCIGPTDRIWIHPSARLTACTLNSENGPIYIGEGVEIQEGSHLRGPIAIGEHTVLKMGTRVYGPTAFGPQCRIGGEVSNCAFAGYSNKGHDGFLGNSVIGKWCNLGADTNSSNLKSNYSTVRLWNEERGELIDSGLQFCGVLMGDHTKCGINTMFNTGTVIGTGCNIFGGGFQPKHIPSFSWGGDDTWALHGFDRFIATAERVMARRGAALTQDEIDALREQHQEASARFE